MISIGRLAFVVTVAALSAAHAEAQRKPTPLSAAQTAQMFDTWDRNKNGRLEKLEWVATLPESMKPGANTVWPRIDTTGQGFVTKERFVTTYRPSPPPE